MKVPISKKNNDLIFFNDKFIRVLMERYYICIGKKSLNIMLRAIKVRLYPNKEQELKLNKVLGCYRFVYNQMLALKQKEYNENKKSLGLTELSKYFHGTLLQNESYAWLKEQNTKVMKQAIRQMLTAYDKFFKQHNGFPKFKTKKDKQSTLFPSEAISKGNEFNERKNNHKEVVLVDRFFPSSKTCHSCGYVNKELTLKGRKWVCPVCGEQHDRDLNAAINMLIEGERIIGSRTAKFTLMEKPTVDDRTLCS